MRNPFHEKVFGLLLICLLFILIKSIWLDRIEEFISWGSEVGDVVFQLALAYVGGYIFYYIANLEENKKDEKKNLIINKKKVELLIFHIEIFIYSYFVFSGNKESVKTSNDLIDKNIENLNLVINTWDENELYKISEYVGEDIVKKNAIYFDQFIQNANSLQNIIEKCVDGYVMMPITLIEVIESLDDESNIFDLLKRIKGLKKYLKYSSNNGDSTYGIFPKDNQDIRKEVTILRSHLIILKSYFRKEFKDDYNVLFKVEDFIWRPEYNLNLINKKAQS
ncbi:hypothetical protein [Sphingobacterium cellulitidis]|uniref:hypothetical protein n=1 Tax=Sphingobacterium cellulitidis TaxID=1768011 RepID=UPI000B9423B0|nr:hypothetical protein CHT99_15590 [Sphingobacterium cellulitidis]